MKVMRITTTIKAELLALSGITAAFGSACAEPALSKAVRRLRVVVCHGDSATIKATRTEAAELSRFIEHPQGELPAHPGQLRGYSSG